MGIGINAEQQLGDDVGLFFRAMYADGKSEVYSYTSSDRSISLGGIVKGDRWNRPKDAVGIGFQQGWISNQHAQFLNMGGVDGFIGDGKINAAPERVAEIYYKVHAFTSTWLTLDYQHIMNPAYNADRGDVDIYGIRAHFEF
jgi:carbohydrate-selective porin OprB